MSRPDTPAPDTPSPDTSAPDTSALEAAVARLDRGSEQLLARSAEVYEALARASATVSDQQVELTVAPDGTLTRIGFTASPTSHTSLTTAVGTLYRRAAAAANEAVAEAVPEVAEGVRGAGAQAGGDEDVAPPRPGHEPTLDATADGWRPSRSATASQGPALSALDRLVEQVETAHDLGSLRSAFDDPAVAPAMTGGDPATWQRDLERRIAAVGTPGAQLQAQLGQVRAEADSRTVQITVGATGGLVGVAFHLAARGAEPDRLSEEFMQTYHRASQQAAAQVAALLTGLDVSDEALGGGSRPRPEEV